jgi:hypothetical protein
VPLQQVCAAAGRKNTSVPMSCGRCSPLSVCGVSYQNAAVSISFVSRTTSQSRLASALRCSPEFADPTTGFWPMTMKPFVSPSSMRWTIA